MRKECPDYKIGSTLAGMVLLPWLGLGLPENHFQPYSIVRKAGNAFAKGYGFPTDTWTFEYMSQPQLDELMRLMTNPTDGSGVVYIRTYKDYGVKRTLANFKAIMYRPTDGNGKDLIPQSRAVWADVTIQFGHLVEQ